MLVDHQLEQVNKLQRELASCMSDEERGVVCCQTRDSLLGDHENLEILSAVCRDIMEAAGQRCTSRGSDGSWRQFTQLAAKGVKLRDARAKTLQIVADCWGAKVAHHYGWGTIRHNHCQKLRAAATEMDWPTFVRRVNQVLTDRHRPTALNVRAIPDSTNPIMPSDIEMTRRLGRRGTKAQRPANEKELESHYKAAKNESESYYRATNRLPAGLGLDRFGVVVREQYDDRPSSPEIDSQHNERENPAPSARANIALPRSLRMGYSEASQIEAACPSAASAANIRTADIVTLPFPPSPPSSPDAATNSTSSSTAESEQLLLSHTSRGKRTAPTLPSRVFKRQRTRLAIHTAAADARKVYGKSKAVLSLRCNR